MLFCVATCAFAQTESERFDINRFDINRFDINRFDINRFDINRFDIDGNTLLNAAEIEALLRPFTGSRREYGDVQRALEALEVRYRERGFSAVQVTVPEQELGGTVRLRVIEASIRRIRVEGAQFFDEPNVRRSLPALREGG